MGLDMYANHTKFKPESQVDFQVPEELENEEFQYWRKHPNLHGWMDDLYRKKGGSSEFFNCVNVQLTEEDLNNLEKTIKDNELPGTMGFFFGESSGDEEEVNKDLAFIENAKRLIQEGNTVYYSSWW